MPHELCWAAVWITEYSAADAALALSYCSRAWCGELQEPAIWHLGSQDWVEIEAISIDFHRFSSISMTFSQRLRGLRPLRRRYLLSKAYLCRPVLSDGAGELFCGSQVHSLCLRGIVAALRRPTWWQRLPAMKRLVAQGRLRQPRLQELRQELCGEALARAMRTRTPPRRRRRVAPETPPKPRRAARTSYAAQAAKVCRLIEAAKAKADAKAASSESSSSSSSSSRRLDCSLRMAKR